MGTLTTIQTHDPAATRRAAFEDRYGSGAHERLLRLLAQPCFSFAQIAAEFGVTRERVRQWRRQWLPDSPPGRQRRRMCATYQEKRRLMLDPVFRAFHQHARAWLGPGRIHLLRSRRGYRTRTVRIDRHLVVLRDAVAQAPRYRGPADFIYFRLSDDQFLFVAARAARAASHPRNTFAALDAAPGTARVSFTSKEHSL